MFKKLRTFAGNNLVNISGWKTNRKIIVFVSDDWGSIRMPSKHVYKKLLDEGIPVDKSTYDTFDTLEDRNDLEYLFNMLVKYEDDFGNHPVFTFNTVMGNPDFERIKEGKFRKYYYEDMEVSYQKYNKDNIFDLWMNAIGNQVMYPQFHAREHLNVSLWMKGLLKKNSQTRTAFDHSFFGLKTSTPSSHQHNYLAAYWAEDRQDFKLKADILRDGLEIFKEKFGFYSESFVACNHIYPSLIEPVLFDFGVRYIQTQRGHISPDIDTGKRRVRRHFTGQVNELNQRYLVRNCTFEPTLEHGIEAVNNCVKEIELAFKWNTPAIISTHRINYVGGLEIGNREKGLKKLDKLLNEVLGKWPDVEFVSINELGRIMEKGL